MHCVVGYSHITKCFVLNPKMVNIDSCNPYKLKLFGSSTAFKSCRGFLRPKSLKTAFVDELTQIVDVVQVR